MKTITLTLILILAINIHANTQNQAIGDFTGLQPGIQNSLLHLPIEHNFQYLAEEGFQMSDGSYFPTRNDFAGYVPISNSSINGYLCINSEWFPTGGVSIIDVVFNTSTKLWELSNSGRVDFSAVGGTGRNCSGTITPWNTLITCEEALMPDFNGDTYRDLGWAVEIDPATKTVIDQNGGLNGADKLWAMGNFAHENAVVHSNRRTVYQGADSNPGYLFKFVADQAEDLSSGDLYVYKGSKNGVGNWLPLLNDTAADQNSTLSQCFTLGATVFVGVEDVEINPSNGMVYLAVKGENSIYRFTDDDPIAGTTVTGFETIVGGIGTAYTVPHVGGSTLVAWGTGNDNLVFDNNDNLWVCQDGGDNYIWVIDAAHTQANPVIKIFARPPAGSEPTGITFTPDNKFMFLSIQHPAASNTSTYQTDAEGIDRYFHKNVTIVIARSNNIGTGVTCPTFVDLGSNSITSGIYKSDGTLISSNHFGANNQVSLTATNTVCVDDGFEVKLGTELDIRIEACN